MTTLATLVIASGALAAAGKVPWWQSGSAPVDPAAVASLAAEPLHAKLLVNRARTVAAAQRAALVAAPLDDGGYCLIPAWKGRGDLGDQCISSVTSDDAAAHDVILSVAVPAGREGGPAWIVYGRFTERSVGAIDLGPFTVQLANGGFFIFEIPTTRWAGLADTANRAKLLSTSGTTLATGCLSWGIPPNDPRVADSGAELDFFRAPTRIACAPQQLAPLPTLLLRRAEKLFDVTLINSFSIWKAGQTIAFWEAPVSTGGRRCAFPAPVTGPNASERREVGNCRATDPARGKQQTLEVELDAGVFHVDHVPRYAFSISGSVDPTAGIVRLVLRSDAGSTPVTFGGGYFFVQIGPTSESSGRLPKGGPFTLLAYNAAGRRVAHVNLASLRP